MARLCSVCRNPNRVQLDGGIADGTGYRALSQQYGVGEDSIRRHALAHLAPAQPQVVADTIAEEGLVAEVTFRYAANGNREAWSGGPFHLEAAPGRTPGEVRRLLAEQENHLTRELNVRPFADGTPPEPVIPFRPF